ncbi:hypothetical protein [Devosia sp.]|uniref:hypothetical protein n=1 Tax=Devosia sp. TaxID=1871048 RepID=UPI0025C4BEAC|nr:hypothetical protein [Devosia sp.]
MYRGGYWGKVRGDDLPAGGDLAEFDFAVTAARIGRRSISRTLPVPRQMGRSAR